MGEVFIVYRISLEEPEKIEEVRKKISELKPKELKEEEIGFGIKVLKAMFIVSDDEGIGELEEKLNSIEGISTIDVEDMGRL